MLAWTIEAFLQDPAIGQIMTVIHPDDTDLYEHAVAPIADPKLVKPVHGGDTRAASVRLGLEALAGSPPDHVLIHDAARPFPKPSLISEICTALDEADGAFAAIPVVDALWSSRDGLAEAPVPRDGLWRAQTPQGFRFEKILAAHQSLANTNATDDVAIARASGLDVRIIEGHESNFKITTAADFARAETHFAENR